MCSGAVLHARLKRVVFGASDPKTGAAGSVLNLFGIRQLNHHTEVVGGVLAKECSTLLTEFFAERRHAQRASRVALRDDALRTPVHRFENLLDYPWPANYVSDLPCLQGLCLHYLDLGPRSSALTYLCLHGNRGWSYLYRRMMPVFEAAGSRVVTPDLIGFGKSDKPKKEAFHSMGWHRQMLLELIERLDLRNIVLVLHDWGALLGLTLPQADPSRFNGVLLMDGILAQDAPALNATERAAFAAPFPDRGYRAALRALARPILPFDSEDEVAIVAQTRQFWREHWRGRILMAIGMHDTEKAAAILREFEALLFERPAPGLLPQSGQFAPDHGQAIAEQAVKFFCLESRLSPA